MRKNFYAIIFYPLLYLIIWVCILLLLQITFLNSYLYVILFIGANIYIAMTMRQYKKFLRFLLKSFYPGKFRRLISIKAENDKKGFFHDVSELQFLGINDHDDTKEVTFIKIGIMILYSFPFIIFLTTIILYLIVKLL